MKLNFVSCGSGEPIIFHHGLGGSSQKSLGFLSELTEYCIIAPDGAGHGTSPMPPKVNFDVFADCLLDVADETAVHQGIYGGISMGAGIALNLALRHPERVKALIIVRPAWVAEARPAHLEAMYDLCYRKINGLPLEDWQHDPIHQPILAAFPYLREHCEGMLTAPDSFLNLVIDIVNDKPFNDLQILKKINIPSLVLSSTWDYVHPVSVAQQIAEQLPQVTYYELPPRYRDEAYFKQQASLQIKKFLNTLT
jgi:pimeloyl-ACP methyl ester carboxylesterase